MTRTTQNGISIHANGNGPGSHNGQVPPSPNGASPQRPGFDQPVILRQSPTWSRAIVWAILGVTTATVLWACLAKVEETVPAQGKLEPKGVVQPVQTAGGGVIKTIHVQEGDQVQAGDLLITFDQETAQAELKSLEEIRQRILTENDFYRALRSGAIAEGMPESISGDLRQRIQERSTLADSNEVYRAQLNGNASGLSANQKDEVATARGRFSEQQTQNQSQVTQLREQLSQAKSELENAKNDLTTNQEILERLRRLEESGAIAELSRLQQEQEVNTRLTRVNTLTDEINRLQAQINQATAEIGRTGYEFRETLQSRIRNNNERMSAIDSELGQLILQNETRLQEIDSRIVQLRQQLTYQELKAPVSGTVFNLKANQPGYAANSTEPILEIVPEDLLVARVFIPNKDIGFVQIKEDCQAAAQAEDEAAIQQTCKAVDVRIDAFPYSEFGSVNGYLTSIGSDALPPDEIFPFYRFPAEVRLDPNSIDEFLAGITQDSNNPVRLRSGMSLNANIKLRKRRVITFFTDLFVRKADSVRSGG